MVTKHRGRVASSGEAPPSGRLTFNEMTWELLEEKQGVVEAQREVLFAEYSPIEPSAALVEWLKRGQRSKLANERAKAYRLVDPVISELEALRRGLISSVPEPSIEVEGMEGLCGNPDFVISGTNTSKIVPIVTIVEAKKDDIDAGLPQCTAELYAAYLLNGERPSRLYGCVTTGRDWQFLCLDGRDKRAYVDLDMYYINELPKLLGVFCHIVDMTLQALDLR